MPVSDRDHIGRDIGRHVIGLGFDNRQGGHGTGAEIIVHFGSALQQARMQKEHIPRIGFAPRRAAQQQRHLPIGHGLFRQIVIGDQCVHAIVAEIFAHCATGKRRQKLQWCGFRGGGSDNN